MDLTNCVIAITGAGQGLGLAMATTLSKAGADLALIDINHGSLKQASQTVARFGHRVGSYCVDVTKETDVEQAFTDILDDFGQLNGLVNNAGIISDAMLISPKAQPMAKMSLSQFEQVISINLTGTFLCGREAAYQMVKHQCQGVIINISSVARAGNIGQTNYAASKAAVATMAVGWAKELARYGIRAAAVAPGVVETAMATQFKPEAKERLKQMIPLQRTGDPDEIASAVRFIFENDYFTGRILEVDGGLRM